MSLLLASAAASALGAVISLVLAKSESTSKVVGCVFGIVAAVLAIAAGCAGIVSAQLVNYATVLSFANFSILLNPLAGLLLLVINVLALAAWIYGFSYFDEYRGRGLGTLGFYMNVFVLAMNFVVTVDNAFWFLVFFELMSLSSYFLVIVDKTPEAMRGGLMYFIMAHVGFLMIMIAFFLMASATGSLEFETYRNTAFAPGLATAVFLLAFFGFGCKAGMVPVHSWLPQAHPAAPSNVSALMSGGMIKIGIFGMVKVAFDLLSACPVQIWWGFVVLTVGAVSSVLGVAYALREHDLKSLLAYHSVENIGIILLGVGAALVAAGLGSGLLAAFALMAALYHVINHAMFKGLLFMGAGSILYRTGTRDIRLLGGLGKLMPITSICFLIGSMAICALPPLNGFVSEWYTYQASFDIALVGDGLVTAFMAFGMVSLAITGALAVVCFVKAYSLSFSGRARSEGARTATESPVSMRIALVLLAAICVCLGLGAYWVTPVVNWIASSVVEAPVPLVGASTAVINPLLGTAVSTIVVGVLVAIGILLGFAIVKIKGSGSVATDRDPWACGYAPTPEMPMSTSSFAGEVDLFMHPLYQVRASIVAASTKASAAMRAAFGFADAPTDAGAAPANPFAAGATFLGHLAQKLEGGNYRVYIVYIVVALVVLLALLVMAQLGGGAR